MKFCTRTLLAILLVAMFVGAGGPPAASLAQSSATLPDCPQIGVIYTAVSPFFEQDETLFMWGLATLWRSTDGDATWQAVYQVPTGAGYRIGQLLIAPVAPEEGLHLYLAFWDAYYRTYSPDSGDTWEALWSDATVTCWQAATNQDGTLFASCMTFPRNPPKPDGIHRSTDHGHTWQHVWTESGSGEEPVPSPDYANDQTVFAIRYPLSPDAGPYPMHSADGGVSWQDIVPGLCLDGPYTNVREIVVSPDFPADQTLFGRAYGHLLKSEDGGTSWRHLYPEDEDPCQDSSDWVWQVALSPDYASDQTIFMRTDSGLHVSYDDGRHWRQLLEASQIGGDILVRRRPKDAYRSLHLPLLFRGVAPGTAIPHRTFLPLLAGSGALPHPTPLTLFAKKRGEYTYVRSDNGGITWRCVNPPP